MKKIILIVAALLSCMTGYAAAPATGPIQNHCTLGATQAKLSGLLSTNYLQGIIPSCTVTVYLTGTQTLATIYADGNGTPLANPFTANTPLSVDPGGWVFWAALVQGYDVQLSGGVPPNIYTQPVTLNDLIVGGGTGGGGGGSGCTITGATGQILYNASGTCTGAGGFTYTVGTGGLSGVVSTPNLVVNGDATFEASLENVPRAQYDPTAPQYAGGLAATQNPAQMSATMDAVMQAAYCNSSNGSQVTIPVSIPLVVSRPIVVYGNTRLDCSTGGDFGSCFVSLASGTVGQPVIMTSGTTSITCPGASPSVPTGNGAVIEHMIVNGQGVAGGPSDQGIQDNDGHTLVAHNTLGQNNGFGGYAIFNVGTDSRIVHNYVNNAQTYYWGNNVTNTPVGAMGCLGTDSHCNENEVSDGTGLANNHRLTGVSAQNMACIVASGGNEEVSNNLMQLCNIGLITAVNSASGTFQNNRFDGMSGAAVLNYGSASNFTSSRFLYDCLDPNATNCHPYVDEPSAGGSKLIGTTVGITSGQFGTTNAASLYDIEAPNAILSANDKIPGITYSGNQIIPEAVLSATGSADVTGTILAASGTNAPNVNAYGGVVFTDTAPIQVNTFHGGVLGQRIQVFGGNSNVTIVPSPQSFFGFQQIKTCDGEALNLGPVQGSVFFDVEQNSIQQECSTFFGYSHLNNPGNAYYTLSSPDILDVVGNESLRPILNAAVFVGPDNPGSGAGTCYVGEAIVGTGRIVQTTPACTSLTPSGGAPVGLAAGAPAQYSTFNVYRYSTTVGGLATGKIATYTTGTLPAQIVDAGGAPISTPLPTLGYNSTGYLDLNGTIFSNITPSPTGSCTQQQFNVNSTGAQYCNGTTWAALGSGGGGGSITGVSSGTGLTGGGTSGSVTLALATPVAVANGGTGTNSPSLSAGTGVTVTGSWPNQTIGLATGTGTGTNVFQVSPTLVTPNLGTPSAITLTNATGLPLASGVTGILPVANGGNGTGTPSLVAGTNVTITGSWPNQTISSTGGGGSGTISGQTVGSLLLATSATASTASSLISESGGTAIVADPNGLSVTGSGSTPSQIGFANTGNACAVPSAGINLCAPASVTTPSVLNLPAAPFTGIVKYTNASGIMSTGAAVGGTDYVSPSVTAAQSVAGPFTATTVSSGGTSNGALDMTYTGTAATAPATNTVGWSPNIAITTPYRFSPAAAPASGFMFGTVSGAIDQLSFIAASQVYGTCSGCATPSGGGGLTGTTHQNDISGTLGILGSGPTTNPTLTAAAATTDTSFTVSSTAGFTFTPGAGGVDLLIGPNDYVTEKVNCTVITDSTHFGSCTRAGWGGTALALPSGAIVYEISEVESDSYSGLPNNFHIWKGPTFIGFGGQPFSALSGYTGNGPLGSTGQIIFNPNILGGLNINNNGITVYGGAINASAQAATVANSLGGTETITGTPAASTSALLINGTPTTGLTTSTAFPEFLIQPTGTTAVTSWSTNNTDFGINAGVTTGNFLDFHTLGSAAAFTLTRTGVMTLAGNLNPGGNEVLTGNFSENGTGSQTFAGPIQGQAANWSGNVSHLASNTATSGSNYGSTLINMGCSYYPTGGPAVTSTQCFDMAVQMNSGATPNETLVIQGAGSPPANQVIKLNNTTQVGSLAGIAGLAPTYTAGTAAGTTPTITFASNSGNLAGVINVTTGTSPAASAAVVTIIFNTTNPFVTALPFCSALPNNAATAALVGAAQAFVFSANTTLLQFQLTQGSTALAASTAYSWVYSCL